MMLTHMVCSPLPKSKLATLQWSPHQMNFVVYKLEFQLGEVK